MQRGTVLRVLACLCNAVWCGNVLQPSEPPQDADLYVYFLLGQSNMGGHGNGSALSADLVDTLTKISTEEPASVEFYAASHACGGSCTSAKCNGHSYLPVERLPLLPVKSCSADEPLFDMTTRFGPEISFGLALHRTFPTRRFAISKRAVNGGGISHWNPPKGNAYDGLMQDLQALRDLHPNQNVKPAGILWLQGEANSKPIGEGGAHYEEQLLALIAAARKDMGVPNLPVVMVEIPNSYEGDHGLYTQKYLRQVLAAYKKAAALPNVVLMRNDRNVSSEDHMETGHDENQPAPWGDKEKTFMRNICDHYLASALLKIGERAAAMFSTLGGWEHLPSPELPTLVSKAREISQRRVESMATRRNASPDSQC